jgi:hypothetical protein
VLHFARMLRRRVDLHAAVLARHRERNLPFEIEVVLAADARRTAQTMRGARQCRRGVASSRGPAATYDCAASVVDGQDRGRLQIEPGSLPAPRCSRRAPPRRNRLPANSTTSCADRIVVLIGPTSLTPGISAR